MKSQAQIFTKHLIYSSQCLWSILSSYFFSNGETEVRGSVERATVSSMWAAEPPSKPWPGPDSQANQITISHLLPPHTCSLDFILVFRSLFSSLSRISVHPHTPPPRSVDTHEVSQSPWDLGLLVHSSARETSAIFEGQWEPFLQLPCLHRAVRFHTIIPVRTTITMPGGGEGLGVAPLDTF